MKEIDLKAKIFYYFHNKYYNLMLNTAKEGITTFKGDVSFHLYHSLALFLINRLEEGIHDLESLRQENDVKLAVTIALMYGHKLIGVTNKELFVNLDAQMREYRKKSEALDFYYSAFVLVTLNKLEKALDYADKALTLQSSLSECLTLKGWILLMLKKSGKSSTNIKSIFQTSLQHNSQNLSTILGYTECCLYQNDFTDALNTINKAVVRYTATPLPLLQKLKVHFAAQDWDQTQETINRININDPTNLQTMPFSIIMLICKSAKYKEAAVEIEKFLNQIKKTEPNNVQILLDYSKLFARICNRHSVILKETVHMLETAIQANPENAELIVELGHQSFLLGKTKESSRYFKSATKIDESCFDALLGLSLCELSDNCKSEQLEEQVQYLLELKDAENSLMFHLLQAKISKNSNEALVYLKTIFETKLSQLKSTYYSDSYLLTLDPDFTLDVVKEYMQHTSNLKNPIENACELLSLIVKACPGSSEALYLLAKLQYIKKDNANALSTLEKLMTNIENSPSEAHLLMAQIQVESGLFERASQSLEQCMSNNFKIRENPIYHYILALVDKNSNNYADAIKALTTALSLVNIKSNTEVSLVEKACIYVELIDTLNIIGQTDEASKILGDATEELQGTPEEARILLLSAENLLARKNIQGALDLLGKISPGETSYKDTKMKSADILLKYRKDKYAFLQVYQDFVNDDPGPESYVLLGDAYMRVLEPDDALDCYDKALKANPQDPFLLSKMGKALVETHYFARAVNYYKDAIKNANNSDLKLQLAELYLNLKEYEKGELLLLNELEEEGNPFKLEDLTYLQYKTKLLHLLAQIQEKSGNVTYAIKSLKDAMDNQNRVRKRLAVEQNSVPESELKFLIDLSIKLGEMAISQKNNEQAINYYKEGLEASPDNTTILVALAKLYMQMNYLELCQQTCSNVLRVDPENETASVMMADIAFRKVDFDMALFHFTQLILKQPTNWEALIRLIEIARRTGNLKDCPEYLNVAEKHCDSPSKEPGFLYCTALYQWYSGNLNGALKNFNSARQDPEYGQTAIYNMIEICLNPDDEMLTDQFVDNDDREYKDSRTMALKTADRLLKELKQRIDTNGDEILRYHLLSSFSLLATKEKYNIERALDDFISIASQNIYKDNIGATLGIATAYTLLKQGQRAKNQLKRIVKTTWTFEDAEYLERCWLLLADYYIQSGKFDIANDLISKVVLHNKACTKAYEYLGFISEKEQRYKDAANNYRQAWKFGGKSSPGIGYKLSYCLMKCKKYPDAIDTAQEVLKLSPDYPRVKKDILDKCMNNLRI